MNATATNTLRKVDALNSLIANGATPVLYVYNGTGNNKWNTKKLFVTRVNAEYCKIIQDYDITLICRNDEGNEVSQQSEFAEIKKLIAQVSGH